MQGIKKKIGTLFIYVVLLSYILDKAAYFAIKSIEENVFAGQNVGKFNHYLQLKDSVDLIFFGSSRTNRHFNPEMFSKKAFNMGIDGRQLAFTWAAIKMLPADKQQDVIVNVDPSNVFNPAYKGDDIYSLNYQFHKDPKIREELTRNGQQNPLIHFYWCTGYNGKLISILVNYLKPKYDFKNYNGFDPLRVTENQKIIRDKKFQRELLEEDCTDENTIITPNTLALDYLKRIVEHCRKNNKTLFIVTTPIRNDQCKLDNQRLNAIMDSLGVSYWDLTDFFKKDTNPDLWKDKLHLSSTGADSFSKYISSEIERYQ